MDLTKKLLAVLDDPSDVWTSVVNNLAGEVRLTLMVFTTHLTPVTLIDWQESLAKIDPAAATVFERSLKTLDDTFISTERDRHSNYFAQFRNPSMDDFCAEYLNKNVGFISTVLSREPEPRQFLRLTQLATATTGLPGNFASRYQHLFARTTSGSTRRYRNIHQFLTNGNNIKTMIDAIVEAYQASPRPQKDTLIVSMFVLIGSAKDFDADASSSAREQLREVIEAISKWDIHTTRILDDKIAIRGLRRFLDKDFTSFYETLCTEVGGLRAYDCLANLESALGMDGAESDWRDRFVAAASERLEEVDVSDVAVAAKQYYENVAYHLGLDDPWAVDAWEDRINELRAEEGSPDEDEDDDRWERGQSKRGAAGDEAVIDAMFSGLIDRGM